MHLDTCKIDPHGATRSLKKQSSAKEIGDSDVQYGNINNMIMDEVISPLSVLFSVSKKIV